LLARDAHLANEQQRERERKKEKGFWPHAMSTSPGQSQSVVISTSQQPEAYQRYLRPASN